MQLDKIIDTICNNPDFYRNGYNLDSEDKAVISPADVWEVSFIREIPLEVVKFIDTCFFRADGKDYMSFQIKEWMGKQKYLLGTKLGRNPTSKELIADAEKHHNFDRYPLCYVLNFPQRAKFDMSNYKNHQELVCWFLAGAEKLHPQNYPYFDVIRRNSGFSG